VGYVGVDSWMTRAYREDSAHKPAQGSCIEGGGEEGGSIEKKEKKLVGNSLSNIEHG